MSKSRPVLYTLFGEIHEGPDVYTLSCRASTSAHLQPGTNFLSRPVNSCDPCNPLVHKEKVEVRKNGVRSTPRHILRDKCDRRILGAGSDLLSLAFFGARKCSCVPLAEGLLVYFSRMTIISLAANNPMIRFPLQQQRPEYRAFMYVVLSYITTDVQYST